VAAHLEHRIRQITGLIHHLEITVQFEQHAQASAHHHVVINHQYSKHFAHHSPNESAVAQSHDPRDRGCAARSPPRQ
jgi:hypothetical protein